MVKIFYSIYIIFCLYFRIVFEFLFGFEYFDSMVFLRGGICLILCIFYLGIKYHGWIKDILTLE